MRCDLCVEVEKNACDLRNLLTATPLWAAAAARAAAHMLPTQRRRLRLLQQRRPNAKLVPHSTASTKRNNNNRAPHCRCTVVHKLIYAVIIPQQSVFYFWPGDYNSRYYRRFSMLYLILNLFLNLIGTAFL